MITKEFAEIKNEINTHFILKNELENSAMPPNVFRIVCVMMTAEGNECMAIAPNGYACNITDNAEVIVVNLSKS